MLETKQNLFDFEDYRKYLEGRLPISGPERGLRTRLAHALNCQSAFISRVLHGEAHFSLEHSVRINHFLSHTEAEGDYFLLLVHHARAGSRDLERYYEKQIRAIQEKRQVIAERLQVKQALSPEVEATYYSHWYYAAVQAALLIPTLQTPPVLARHLGLPLQKIAEILEFLVKTGIAKQEGSKFVPGESRLHVRRDSPMFTRHHCNWRMRSIDALDRISGPGSREDVFFSGPICLSEKDAARIRTLLLEFIERSEKIIGPSENEALFCLATDFFRI